MLLELLLLHFPTNPGDASNQPPIETGVKEPVTPQYMSNSITAKNRHLDLEEALQYTREDDRFYTEVYFSYEEYEIIQQRRKNFE